MKVFTFLVLTALSNLSVLILAPQQNAHAWGDVGHRAVGLIGERNLSKKAKKAVREIMGTESLARAATYPDEIRSDPSLQIEDGKQVSYWHFTEVLQGQTYETTPHSPNGNIYEAILRMKARLKDSKNSLENKKNAIRWLAHLVGDIHMPLHVGNGLDRGANLCAVIWKGQATNLHSVIDDGMIEQIKLSYTELADFVSAKAVKKDQKAALAAGSEMDWLKETVEARESLYPVAKGENPRNYCKTVDAQGSVIEPTGYAPYDFGSSGHYTYTYNARPLLEKRILQAGLRLARTLNEIFE